MAPCWSIRAIWRRRCFYYLRDSEVPLHVWARGEEPHNHFEMTRPFTASTPELILLVSLRPCPRTIMRSFDDVRHLGVVRVPIVRHQARMVHFCRLAGYRSGQ